MPPEVFLELVNKKSIPNVFEDTDEYLMFIKTILNLKNILIENELSTDQMISILIEKMFKEREISPLDIDLLIVSQENRMNSIGNLPHFLQYNHKMSKASVLNISGNHCANAEVAVAFAHSLLRGNDKLHNILIVSSIKTANPDNRIIGTYGILGDAAGIILVGKGNARVQLIDNLVLTNGLLFKADMNIDNSILHCKYLIKCLTELMGRNDLKAEKVESILIQNANPLLVSQCIAALKLNTDKIFKGNFGKYGHLDSIDFILNLKTIINNIGLNNTNQGELILSVGMGWAGTYVSSLFNIIK